MWACVLDLMWAGVLDTFHRSGQHIQKPKLMVTRTQRQRPSCSCLYLGSCIITGWGWHRLAMYDMWLWSARRIWKQIVRWSSTTQTTRRNTHAADSAECNGKQGFFGFSQEGTQTNTYPITFRCDTFYLDPVYNQDLEVHPATW